MSFVRPKPPVLVSFVVASLAGVLLAGAAGAANQTAPALSGLKARVAHAGRVDLAASSLSASDLARMRPGYESLKPRVRTNAE